MRGIITTTILDRLIAKFPDFLDKIEDFIENHIEEKIRNSFELEFPKQNLEILIGSDASTDHWKLSSNTKES